MGIEQYGYKIAQGIRTSIACRSINTMQLHVNTVPMMECVTGILTSNYVLKLNRPPRATMTLV